MSADLRTGFSVFVRIFDNDFFIVPNVIRRAAHSRNLRSGPCSWLQTTTHSRVSKLCPSFDALTSAGEHRQEVPDAAVRERRTGGATYAHRYRQEHCRSNPVPPAALWRDHWTCFRSMRTKGSVLVLFHQESLRASYFQIPPRSSYDCSLANLSCTIVEIMNSSARVSLASFSMWQRICFGLPQNTKESDSLMNCRSD